MQTERVILVGGILGWFITERMCVNWALADVTARGHRIVLQVPDRWNLIQKLGVFLVALMTAGFYWPRAGYILTTEPVTYHGR